MIRLLLALLLASLPASAFAQILQDQQHLTAGNPRYILDYPGDYLAQTFTLRNSGRILGVGVQAILPDNAALPPTDDLLVRLVKTTPAGAPAPDHLLASRTIPWQEVPTSLSAGESLLVDVFAENIQVRTGDVLAILVSSNHTYYSHSGDYQQYRVHMSFGNPHPGGDMFIYSPALWGPEPFLIRDGFDPPRDTRDLGFEVYLQIPEPAAATLSATLGILLLAVRRAARSS